MNHGESFRVCILSSFSRVQLFVTSWTKALQAPLSMGFFRQKYWSGLPCPPPGDFPDPGIKPTSALACEFFTTSSTWQAHIADTQSQFSLVFFLKFPRMLTT